MKLADYNTLAYQFAIRNRRVIELLDVTLTDEVVKELLTYGIDATSVHFEEGEEIVFNSIQELYLDYEHLKDLKHVPYSPFEAQNDEFKGHQTLIHPKKKSIFFLKELDEDAIVRIKPLIETRGRNLQRLMNGEKFKHYDAVTFFGKTPHSIDTSTHATKTIKRDDEFISEWIQPENYLQLIPQYNATSH